MKREFHFTTHPTLCADPLWADPTACRIIPLFQLPGCPSTRLTASSSSGGGPLRDPAGSGWCRLANRSFLPVKQGTSRPRLIGEGCSPLRH